MIFSFPTQDVETARPPSSRVVTVPNLVTAGRLALLPVFLWTFLTARDGTALVLLVVIGVSDWLDGFLARRLGQVSELGKLLDPVSDRIVIVAVVAVLAFRGSLPWPLAATILARDLVVAVAFAVLEGKGVPRLAVNFTGKTATLLLFTGMSVVVLSVLTGAAPDGIARLIGLAVLVAGAVLYWVAAVLYFGTARRALASIREASR